MELNREATINGVYFPERPHANLLLYGGTNAPLPPPPNDGPAWHYLGEENFQRGDVGRIGVNVNEVLDGIERDGFFIQRGEFRVEQESAIAAATLNAFGLPIRASPGTGCIDRCPRVRDADRQLLHQV